jgi:hypothetical protein
MKASKHTDLFDPKVTTDKRFVIYEDGNEIDRVTRKEINQAIERLRIRNPSCDYKYQYIGHHKMSSS